MPTARCLAQEKLGSYSSPCVAFRKYLKTALVVGRVVRKALVINYVGITILGKEFCSAFWGKCGMRETLLLLQSSR